MQWTAGPNAGFAPAGVATWLPVHPNHAAGVNVADQARDPQSLLNWLRDLVQLRRAQPALLEGEVELLPDTGDVLAFWRRAPEQACLVALNLSEQPAPLRLAQPVRRVLWPAGDLADFGRADDLSLPPYTVLVAEA